MTDEYETKLLAEDNAMALHIQEKCKFETLIEACKVGLADASSQHARDTYDDMINLLTDACHNINYLVRQTSEAAHAHPSSRDLGEVCSKKKMGAVG